MLEEIQTTVLVKQSFSCFIGYQVTMFSLWSFNHQSRTQENQYNFFQKFITI